MRIFFILEHVSGRGGVETVVSTISSFLQQSGHEPFVLLPDPSEFPEWERPLRVHYYDPEPSKSQSPFEWVSKRIIALSELGSCLPRPDVVVGTHVPHTAPYSRMAFGHLANVPIVSWLHSVPSVFKDSHFIQYADLHWCISRGIATMVSELTDNRPAVSWVGNPIPQNVSRIPVLCDNHEHFLYVGRLENSTKRLDVLLHGLSRLDFQWSLDIFGDGPDRQLLEQFSRELGIHDRVTWHGWVDEPWAQLETASCLLLTSDFERFPMVLMEAMARGLPVISSDCPTGPKDIVENGVNGFLFRKGDPSDLHRRLTDFHSLPRTQREQMSLAAQQSMRNFDVGRVVARMYEGLERFWNNTGVNCLDH